MISHVIYIIPRQFETIPLHHIWVYGAHSRSSKSHQIPLLLFSRFEDKSKDRIHNVRFTGSFEWRLRGFLDKEGGEFISQGPQPLLWYTIQLGNLTRSLLTRDGHLKVGAVHCCGECWTEIGLREPHPPVDRVFQGCQPPDVQDEAGCCQVGKKQK